MPALPPIDPDAAIATGIAVAGPGPEVTAEGAARVVRGLRRALAASVDPIVEVTRLPAPGPGAAEMAVVDRATWMRANVEMALTMLDEATGPADPVRTLSAKVAGRANGAELGAALGVLATRILGQFLPFAATPRLVLVAPNVVAVERQLGVRPADFRLWVCLHEQTHRLQFGAAPWLRPYLLARLGDMFAERGTGDVDADPPAAGARRAARPGRARRRPSNLLELITTPEQQAVVADLTAAMSLLEGYADDMMDRVGPDVVPTLDAIRARFEKRRNRGGWVAVVNRLVGMDMKLAQYRDGARFCRAVIGRVGVDGLNAVYADAEHLPRPAEIAEPAAWVRRVHG